MYYIISIVVNKPGIKILAKNLNVPFYDFTFLKSEDNMYVDGFHGGALIYYQIATSMGIKTKQTSFINKFEISSDSFYISDRNKILINH